MKDVPDTETKNANEQLVAPQSIEPARESVPAAMPRVVIVGAGFGGLHAARALRNAPVQVTVVDRNNHHLFQPLLYQVATGVLSPAEISATIRSVLSKQKNAEVLLGEVTGVDVEAQRVLMHDESLPYDYLILATGAKDSYFGHNDWAAIAPGLKSIVQATTIRRRLLLAFEMAEKETDPQKRQALLTFVLVEALPRILMPFDERLAHKAHIALTQLRVEVRTNSPVEAIDSEGVIIAGERIAARTVIWTAGVAASPAGQWLGAETDRGGRVKVGSDATVPGHPTIFVLGDTASFTQDGKPLPGVAQVAIQQGEYVASVIADRVAGKPHPQAFRYVDKGNMAVIGRFYGIVSIGKFRTAGLLGWFLWLVLHLMFLIGFRNRLVVAFQWLVYFTTFQRGARLITFEDTSRQQ
jgi:NADH:ubiquinone reductase (H+-translocating)